MKYLKSIKIGSKILRFPVYFPDATRAVIRSLDSQALLEIGLEGLILNPYHLMSLPGEKAIRKLGGIKKYMSWPGLVVTDSGGWQLLSLVYKDPSFGRVTDQGVVFHKGSLGEKKKYLFTPEKSVQVQFDLDSDILVCLDDCPGRNATKKETERAVFRTIEWAKRCKTEYEKQLKTRSCLTGTSNRTKRPLLLAVVQGGHDKRLRKICAEGLLKIGFDGYGLGGWLSDKSGRLNLKMIGFISKLLPRNRPKFALGVGYPWDIIDLTKLGFQIFDCVIPTRDARHKRLYVWTKDPQKADILKTNSRRLFKFFYPDKEKYSLDKNPVDRFCDCLLCRNYSRAYLHHLFKIQDSLSWRLASLHNLRLYAKLTEILRKNVA